MFEVFGDHMCTVTFMFPVCYPVVFFYLVVEFLLSPFVPLAVSSGEQRLDTGLDAGRAHHGVT